MTVQILKKENEKANISQETSKFTINLTMAIASLIGIWAISCLIGGLTKSGFIGLIKGYISAVTGM